jgi:transcriptional regulator with XRE-family HTH domain
MRLADAHTDAAVLAELGLRIARHRLERNWTQADLAREAGVGQATVQRVESGRSVQMTSMVRLLRTLELLEALDAAIPESVRLPIAELEREQRRTRQRARALREPLQEPRGKRWIWGDEPRGTP